MARVEVEVDLDAFDDDEIVEAAIQIIESSVVMRNRYADEILKVVDENSSADVDAILSVFNPLNGSDLDRALQAIRDRSAHDLQMILS